MLNQKNLLQGYAECGRFYLALFFLFNLFATIVNIAGGTLLSAVLLGMMLPVDWSLNWLNTLIIFSFIILLWGKQYQKLDRISKWIMLTLTLITVLALGMAWQPEHKLPETFSEPSPWVWAAVPFLVALMGWMPAPMELSVSSSFWVVEKVRLSPDYRHQYRRDFHVSYAMIIVLALMFMALGAWVQYGQHTEPLSGGKFVGQFVTLYAQSIGEWTRLPMTFMALMCIYGTTIVAVDGYSRGNHQAFILLTQQKSDPLTEAKHLRYWTLAALLGAWIVMQFFNNAIGKMIPFAMTASFVSAPVFAWLTWHLRGQCGKQSAWVLALAVLGWVYLVAMVGVYFFR